MEKKNSFDTPFLSYLIFSQKYMLHLLDRHLPTELSDMIYRMVHESIMREVCQIIKHKIVFVFVGNRMSFLICEGQNFYYLLDNEICLSSS